MCYNVKVYLYQVYYFRKEDKKMKTQPRKKPVSLETKCASMEVRLWMLSQTLPRQDRALIRNYMKTRDELERRLSSVRRAVIKSGKKHPGCKQPGCHYIV